VSFPFFQPLEKFIDNFMLLQYLDRMRPFLMPENDVTALYLLMESGLEVKVTIGQILTASDLTVPAGILLWMLSMSEEDVALRELARRMGYDPSNVSILAAKLERSGLIKKSVHATDARSRVLGLSDQGRAVWTEIRDRVLAHSSLARLTVDERRQLQALLARMRTSN
jgi:DNA-binding MarR family transcriptional regulator